MRVRLLLLRDCAPSARALAVWSEACGARGIELAVLYSDEPEGAGLMERFALGVLPAVFLDERLAAVGVQSPGEAATLLEEAGRAAGGQTTGAP